MIDLNECGRRISIWRDDADAVQDIVPPLSYMVDQVESRSTLVHPDRLLEQTDLSRAEKQGR